MDNKNKDKNFNARAMKTILEVARSQTRAKMQKKPFKEVMDDWMMTITKLYGTNAIKENIESSKKNLKTMDEAGVMLAVYKSLTYSAIIALEEFLKFINEHERKEEENGKS